VDLVELLKNIEKARDAAREDKEAFLGQADEAKHDKGDCSGPRSRVVIG